MRSPMAEFETLVREAERLPFEGWDFAHLGDRWQYPALPWDLVGMLREHFPGVSGFVDLGTGGGEFLARLAPLPTGTVATEGYEPNLPVARARLGPLGVRVVGGTRDRRLDLPSESADLVHARHEAFDAREVARVLRRGGVFVTQQVGGRNHEEFAHRFGVSGEPPVNRIESAPQLAEEIAAAGLVPVDVREARGRETVRDVGALVYFLRAAPWEVPGFSVDRFRPVLEEIHREIERSGGWSLTSHRLLVVARRP